MAAGCPIVTSDGQALTCTPTQTGYTITKSDGVTGTTIEVTPPLIECTPQIGDSLELAWMCIGVIATAWGFKIIAKAIH
ncbi:hypothetical protein [Methylobacillus sp. Pita1]|uniref:hypothetical protein n=1 Tax=Methylobacillus sp. Pita1 TaxID=3382642 RepID=UPI0038B6298B